MDEQTVEPDLRTGPPPVTGRPEPATGVDDRVNRRGRTGLIAAITAAVLLAGTAAAAVVAHDTAPPPDATIVAAEPVAAPRILRRSPRPDRQPCHLEGVGSVGWIVQSAPWGPSTGFALRPNNPERCTLSDEPRLSGTNLATGVSEPVAAVDLGPLDDSITRQFPATVDPGEPARIHIRGNTRCPAGQKPRSYRDLMLTVGDKRLPLPGFRTLTGICGADVSPWFVEPPIDYAALNATVQAPPVLRRGQDFTYTVRIANVFPRGYPMSSCPSFRLGLAATETETWQRIACTQTRIAAHGGIQFILRGRVPPDTKPGQHRLTWMAVMSNGEAAIADMATDGTTVTITG